MCRDGHDSLALGVHSEQLKRKKRKKKKKEKRKKKKEKRKRKKEKEKRRAARLQQRCMGRDSVMETKAFGFAMLKQPDSSVLASDVAEQFQSHCLGMWRSLI